MKQRRIISQLRVASAAGVMLIAPGLIWAEDVSVTAYYPSPRGVYDELRTSNNTYLATEGGKVGFGTKTPETQLHVQVVDDGAGNANRGPVTLTTSSDINHSRINFQRSIGNAGTPASDVTNNDILGAIRFEGRKLGIYQTAAKIRGEVDGVPAAGTSDLPGRLTFYTEPAGGANNTKERMRIDSAGHVGIGTTSPQGQLHVVGDSSSNSTADVTFTMYGNNNGEYPRLRFERSRGSFSPPGPLPVGLNDQLGLINFRGFHGAADGSFTDGASVRIRAQVDGPVALNDVPGRLVIETHQSGSGGGATTERMRIDSAGHVGIGLPVQGDPTPIGPSTLLHLLDDDGAGPLAIESNSGSQPPRIEFRRAGGNLGDPAAIGMNDSMGALLFEGHNGAQYLSGAHIEGKVDGAIGAADMPGRLEFYTRPPGSGNTLERMRIDSAGRVGIGTTTPSADLQVTSAQGTSLEVVGDNGTMGNGSKIRLSHMDNSRFLQMRIGDDVDLESGGADLYINNGSGFDVRLISGAGAGGKVGIGMTANQIIGAKLHVNGDVKVDGNIAVVGDITATGSITGASDSRLKTDVVPLSGALEKIAALQAVSYKWNETAKSLGYDATRPQIGVIAQEIETVYPELVMMGANGYRSVDYARMSAVLLEAVKELKAQSEALQARVKALEQERDSTQPVP